MITTKNMRVFVLSLWALLGAWSVVHAEKSVPPKASSDGKIIWYDCKEIGVEGKGWTDTVSFYDRLPGKAEGKVPSSVWGMSHHSAGLCVRFASDAPSIDVRWTLLSANETATHMPATGISGVDLYVKRGRRRQCIF